MKSPSSPLSLRFNKASYLVCLLAKQPLVHSGLKRKFPRVGEKYFTVSIVQVIKTDGNNIIRKIYMDNINNSAIISSDRLHGGRVHHAKFSSRKKSLFLHSIFSAI